MCEDFKYFKRNLIDLISQNDTELMNNTIASKVEQARLIAENKLTNYIENFRFKYKSSHYKLFQSF